LKQNWGRTNYRSVNEQNLESSGHITRNMYKFAAAWSKSRLYLKAQTKLPNQQVLDCHEVLWHQVGLLPCFADNQLARYLLSRHMYQQQFGIFMQTGLQLQISIYLDNETLNENTSVLDTSRKLGEKLWSTALRQRTGHVLPHDWLVVEDYKQKLPAITAVRRTGRNPYEAVIFAVIRGSEIHLKT